MSSKQQSALHSVKTIGRECSNEDLINAVHVLELIWNKKHPSYMSSFKQNYWTKLGGSPVAGTELKARWERLKKTYMKDRRKYDASGSQGGGVVPPFPEYKLMTFLDTVVDDSGSRIDSGTLRKETDMDVVSQRTESALSQEMIEVDEPTGEERILVEMEYMA